VTLPSQARTALHRFPDARLHWFDHCGHFPHWDQPEQTVRVILNGLG
jgi:pimeloyl-ACP methyl ester carboxylesterase